MIHQLNRLLNRIPRNARIILLIVLLAVAVWQTADPTRSQVADAFTQRQSDVMVEDECAVEAVLPDDTRGSRHQRMLVRCQPDVTVLIAHNIDLAPRIADLKRGSSIAFRGEYEWNAKGGVVHWTHHDPRGRRPGGWLRYRGETYR